MKEKITKLIGVQPIVDIVALALQSAFLKDERNGVSLMLLSNPESAKTSTIFNFSDLKFVSYYDEVTQKILLDEFLPFVKTKQKRTLLIPDLINCIDKQKSTREQFLNIIKSGIDDTGILKVQTFHKHLDVKELSMHKYYFGLRFNLITAITVSNFKSIYRKLKNTGLLSRFIPFSYNYSIAKVAKIFQLIADAQTEPNKYDFVKIPKIIQKDKVVKLHTEHINAFQINAKQLGDEYGGYGIRGLVNFRRLLKANALLNGRTETTDEDVEKVMELSKWINFNFNQV